MASSENNSIEIAIVRREVALGETLLKAMQLLIDAERSMLDSVLYCQNDQVQIVQATVNSIVDIHNTIASRFRSAVDAAKEQRDKIY